MVRLGNVEMNRTGHTHGLRSLPQHLWMPPNHEEGSRLGNARGLVRFARLHQLHLTRGHGLFATAVAPSRVHGGATRDEGGSERVVMHLPVAHRISDGPELDPWQPLDAVHR